MLTPGFWPPRDTVDVDFYQIDWSKWLKTEKIVAATWELVVGAGLVISLEQQNDTITTVWLSGGTGDVVAEVACVVTTDSNPPRTKREIGRVRVGINPTGT